VHPLSFLPSQKCWLWLIASEHDIGDDADDTDIPVSASPARPRRGTRSFRRWRRLLLLLLLLLLWLWLSLGASPTSHATRSTCFRRRHLAGLIGRLRSALRSIVSHVCAIAWSVVRRRVDSGSSRAWMKLFALKCQSPMPEKRIWTGAAQVFYDPGGTFVWHVLPVSVVPRGRRADRAPLVEHLRSHISQTACDGRELFGGLEVLRGITWVLDISPESTSRELTCPTMDPWCGKGSSPVYRAPHFTPKSQENGELGKKQLFFGLV
jgi:hypothetical protein